MVIPRKWGSILVLAAIVAFVFFMQSPLNPLRWLIIALVPAKDVAPLTTHIVLFQFKDTATHTAIKEVTSRFMGLKKSCKHPSTGYSYIKSISGGRDNSIENLQNGMSHAFIVHFSSNEDRTYYVDHDPAHQAFKDAVKEFIEKAQVIDFQDGVFT